MSNHSLKYRPCVGIMLINHDGLVWIGKRLKNNPSLPDSHLWQMPQGGIDKGEEPIDAAKRELFEETSISNISFVAESEGWLSYEIPSEMNSGNSWKDLYQGQTQKWFAFKFEGKDSEINISEPPDGHKPEFEKWRWEKASNIPDLIIPFKRKVYERVVANFSEFCTN